VTGRIEFVDIDWDGQQVSIEYQWPGDCDRSRPLVVFLHEGLGSLSMWKDFPDRLCSMAGCRGLVFSRPGYGRSTPRADGKRWSVDYMHRQAYDVLPKLLRALEIDTSLAPIWLFGHSDGGSIALLYASRYPSRTAGLILLSPHIMVEELSVNAIARARSNFLDADSNDFREKLGRYHDDPDSVFWSWNDIWLSPAFRQWSIEDELASIRCPLLAVQGIDDEYGTLEQVRGIARRVARAQVAELADCGHSPQRDQPDRLIDLCANFIAARTDAEDRSRTVCSAG
jgi:pimeloyl-ACP methyl ester carboxylesterase